VCSWRAGCGGSRKSGSEGGGEETTGRKADTGASPPTLRERARQAVRQDCSFAKKQESPYALLVVVQASNIRRVSRMAPFDLRDGAY
jgi:hypothetical protein